MNRDFLILFHREDLIVEDANVPRDMRPTAGAANRNWEAPHVGQRREASSAVLVDTAATSSVNNRARTSGSEVGSRQT